MNSFDMTALVASMAGKPIEYLEFFKVPALSCGIYHLAADSIDPQQPHKVDEIYYVVAGKGRFTGANGEVAIAQGTVLYVAAEEQHKFHNIEQELTLLVVFAPAEN
jgi:mannose-6-phosphate isomerase-like protein (cupin superfamily)